MNISHQYLTVALMKYALNYSKMLTRMPGAWQNNASHEYFKAVCLAGRSKWDRWSFLSLALLDMDCDSPFHIFACLDAKAGWSFYALLEQKYLAQGWLPVLRAFEKALLIHSAHARYHDDSDQEVTSNVKTHLSRGDQGRCWDFLPSSTDDVT